jgi:hypothetical protein
MASRIISESTRNTGGKHKHKDTAWGSHIREDLEDKRVREEKVLYRDNYDALVASGTLRGYSGETQTKEKGDLQNKAHEHNTLIHDIEALKRLWIKDDTCWDTAAVFGEHRKKLRAFSEDYKHRKTKLLGHIIRADNSDPMRKVTFAENSIEEWAINKRRTGRPKDQWIEETKRAAWKKCRHMEDRQGHKKQQKRTKYKRKPIQEAYLHTWAEERKF